MEKYVLQLPNFYESKKFVSNKWKWTISFFLYLNVHIINLAQNIALLQPIFFTKNCGPNLKIIILAQFPKEILLIAMEFKSLSFSTPAIFIAATLHCTLVPLLVSFVCHSTKNSFEKWETCDWGRHKSPIVEILAATTFSV